MQGASRKLTIENALSSDPYVLETKFLQVCPVVNIPQVSNLRVLHQIANPAHIKRAKLVPLSHKDQRIGICNGCIFVLSVLDPRQNLLRLRHRRRVVSANSCATLEQ